MMQIASGATGFFTPGKSNPPVSFDPIKFRRDLYTIAREVSAQVISKPADSVEYPLNFVHALLSFRDSSVRVLLNGLVPYLAFADTDSELYEPVFLHHPVLESAFKNAGGYLLLDK